METEELIPAELFCTSHQVELSFIKSLQTSGLIAVTLREDSLFIPLSGLAILEKFVRLHYEMDINLEGIEAISHLLEKVDNLQEEIIHLRSRLRAYQADAR